MTSFKQKIEAFDMLIEGKLPRFFDDWYANGVATGMAKTLKKNGMNATVKSVKETEYTVKTGKGTATVTLQFGAGSPSKPVTTLEVEVGSDNEFRKLGRFAIWEEDDESYGDDIAKELLQMNIFKGLK